MPDEMPGDQRADDALCACFDTGPLSEPVVLFGRPEARLSLTADRPLALVSARLCDVAPDGASTLVTSGLLNLAHRDGSEEPRELESGATYEVVVPLNFTSQRIPAGHRLRLALSPTYWPQAWPSPYAVTLTLHADATSRLVLPVRPSQPGDAEAPVFGPAVESGPLCGTIRDTADRSRRWWREQGSGALVTEDRTVGSLLISATGTEHRETAIDRWTIVPEDPLSALVECDREIAIDREGWHVRIATTSRQTCDATHIHTQTGIEAFEGGELVFSDRREHAVPRGFY
jgi:hypothetical protein